MIQATVARIRRTGKDAGIEAILLGLDTQDAEPASTVEVAEGGCDYKPLLAKLEEYISYYAVREGRQPTLDHVDTVLTPEQINLFAQTTTLLEDRLNYRARTGSFISKLIQNSYNAGHNNFKIQLENLPPINVIGNYLEGKKEAPLVLTVTGGTANFSGIYAKHTKITVQDTGIAYGWNTENSEFNAERAGKDCGKGAASKSTFNVTQTGDDYGTNSYYSSFQGLKTGDNLGKESRGSTFNVDETGDCCGQYAKHSTFTVKKTGKKCGQGAIKSTFKTTNKRTLRKMLRNVPQGNKVIFIDKIGEEKVMRE